MYIKVSISGQENSYFELDQNQMTLGRSKECDIRINHLDVSRKHLTFFVDGDKIEIMDHASTNGVQREGNSLRPNTKHSIAINDTLALGKNIKMTFMRSEDETQTDLNAEALKEDTLDFTLGEEKTVANMDLSSILASLNKPESKDESDDKRQGALERKIPRVLKKEEALSSSKKPIYKSLAFFMVIGVLIWQKHNIINIFSQKVPPVKTPQVVEKKPQDTKQVIEEKKIEAKPKHLDTSLGYVLQTQTCQSVDESILCNSLRQDRVIRENEGFVQINTSMYLVLTGPVVTDYYHQNLKYDNNELGLLESLLKKDKSVKANIRRLGKKNYEINAMKFDSYKLSYISLLDLAFSNIINTLTSREIKELTIVIRSLQGELIFTKKFSSAQLNFIQGKKEALSPFLKFYFISGYVGPTVRVFQKLEILDL